MNGQVRIAINSMRARLTVLGFNLAVITFLITDLPGRGGDTVNVAPIEHAIHFPEFTSLYMSLSLSFLAMVLYVISNVLDEQGTCDHWTLLLGDILMYLGLGNTIAAFFQPLFADISLMHLETSGQNTALRTLHLVLAAFAATAWIVAVYLGPVVSVLRSPFRRVHTLMVLAVYLVLVGLLTFLWDLATDLQRDLKGKEPYERHLPGRLFMPLEWFRSAQPANEIGKVTLIPDRWKASRHIVLWQLTGREGRDFSHV
ncbi:hypothetical protein SIAM614_02546 [Stappia aggregata IAM 12614]|uniref:Uncharacterized protein n=1 Tax=Roseibium aggregatum (strain ATCC 25650 / DSM 13394 / JCM 20685 / NBRC 16684 / NCIMB 2208 / IAM 12614 / B1) TaxID=384765 RepID=A0NUB8_ROSAI|nr:hypothetical protein [Roseibium aggregatum]EAV43520.1 hypothetical protein SIAM614_02546 [Stappia aggregata IAM 12614] [Roseibium aggregatum IAM 12614]